MKGEEGTPGVRISMRDNVSADPSGPVADPGVSAVLAAAKHSMAVNLLSWGQLLQAGQLAARNPNTRLVIDHLEPRQIRNGHRSSPTRTEMRMKIDPI